MTACVGYGIVTGRNKKDRKTSCGKIPYQRSLLISESDMCIVIRNCSSITFHFCLSNLPCTALSFLEIRQYSCENLPCAEQITLSINLKVISSQFLKTEFELNISTFHFSNSTFKNYVAYNKTYLKTYCTDNLTLYKLALIFIKVYNN